jgi:hypothetical protein
MYIRRIVPVKFTCICNPTGGQGFHPIYNLFAKSNLNFLKKGASSELKGADALFVNLTAGQTLVIRLSLPVRQGVAKSTGAETTGWEPTGFPSHV